MRSLAAFLVAAAAICAVQPGAAAQRARLTVTSKEPLTVRGALFQPGERVKLVARANGVYRRKLTANARGKFVVRFRGVVVEYCQGYVVRADGDRGSYGYVRFVPECAPLGGGA